MASDFSFDISCSFDKQEFQNSIDQARREITNRFDFKGVLATMDVVNNKELILQTESEPKLSALIDIIESKMLKRNLSLAILDTSKTPEPASGGSLRKTVNLISSLDSDQAKDISKIIRQAFPKAKPTIQGDTIRVISKSKDELQAIMQLLRQEKDNLPLKFDNFR